MRLSDNVERELKKVSASQAERAPLRSMTGFAMARAQTAAGELTVTLRSVNHRALDLHFYQHGELAQFENAMRGVLKQHIVRGHVEIRLALARGGDLRSLEYNHELLKRYIELFRQIAAEFNLDGSPDLNTFFALPGVFDSRDGATILDKALEPEIIGALEACIAELNSYREREARELASALEHEIAGIEEKASRIRDIRTQAISHFQQRLRERVTELLQGSAVSESRLIEEAALLADRSDIQEELDRLEVHCREMGRVLEAGGEIGKRVDFLLQEMNRETNTVLSKTSGIGEMGLTITNFALEIKANIERMREQALNFE